MEQTENKLPFPGFGNATWLPDKDGKRVEVGDTIRRGGEDWVVCELLPREVPPDRRMGKYERTGLLDTEYSQLRLVRHASTAIRNFVKELEFSGPVETSISTGVAAKVELTPWEIYDRDLRAAELKVDNIEAAQRELVHKLRDAQRELAEVQEREPRE